MVGHAEILATVVVLLSCLEFQTLVLNMRLTYFKILLPNHGKFTHDANGSITKRMVRDGINSKKFEFVRNQNVSNSEQVANFLNKHFAEKNKQPIVIIREFTSIDLSNFVPKKKQHKTLTKIKSYYSFRTNHLEQNAKNVIYNSFLRF